MSTNSTVNTLNIIVATPTWSLNGVNVFAANLVRGLQAAGISASLLLTHGDRYDSKPMPLPTDIPIDRLPVGRMASWNTRWRMLIRYLEERSPCIYLPNYDFRHSGISPRLSSRVGIVGIVHSDDPKHYEHVVRLGRFWNAVVAVSQTIADHTATLDPTLTSRLVTIPYGVDVPSSLPHRESKEGEPLKVVYAGRLVQQQKRVMDFPKIVSMLVDRGISVELTVIGNGIARQQLIDACEKHMVQGHVKFLGTLANDRVLEIFEQSDVFILTSEFEGLPVSLLEAMGRGCIPVVTDVRSGIPELVQNGVNGFRVSVGDILGFSERLAELQGDIRLRQAMAAQAYNTIQAGSYRREDMIQRYLELFQHILTQAEKGAFRRQSRAILPLPSLTWQNRLLAPLQTLSSYGKHLSVKKAG